MSDSTITFEELNIDLEENVPEEKTKLLNTEIEELLAAIKESRETCKNTAQMLQELNGIFRE